jgi:hypothetical protein
MAIQRDFTNGIDISDLSTIYITGGGFIRKAFHGVGKESQLGYMKTVWATNLNRDNTFALNNIDDVDIGQVAQCDVNFPYMNIQDFMDLQKILKERHCIVDYYNVDLGRRVSQEMAITGNDRKRIYNYGTSIIGMENVSIKFVATNRDAEIGNEITITYDSNGGSGEIEDLETDYAEQEVLSNGLAFTNGTKHIKEWNTKADGTGWAYGLNQSITVWQDLTLYAIWE